MGMISIKQRGDFKALTGFLERTKEMFNSGILDRYGKLGVEALQKATPKNTGKTSESWSYEIRHTRNTATIAFINTNIQNGYNVALVIQNGHVTKQGKWVNGIDYINPALDPILEQLIKEVTPK